MRRVRELLLALLPFGLVPACAPVGSQYSEKVPDGNYRVTIRFPATPNAAHVTVRAEAWRLMLENIEIPAGQAVTRTIIVNVRTPALRAPPANAPGGSAVHLNTTETGSPTWDDKLTLEFLGYAANNAAVSLEPVQVPTVYLAGDSTVTDQRKVGAGSWGQMLPRFFAPDIAIANHAESGQTLKAFLADLRLAKILETLRAGDWLLIQFGHNDQKKEWPQTYVEAGTTYRAYLRMYIAEARRRGATPILITSPERRNFDANGHIIDSHGEYPDAVRAVAREENVALIDLHAMSKTFYEALGPERAALAFTDGGKDRTHHSEYGAYELARMVVTGLRGADPRLTAPLVSHLAADAGTFDPAHPDPPPAMP